MLKGGSAEIDLGIVAEMLGCVCAVMRSACLKLAADMAGVTAAPRRAGEIGHSEEGEKEEFLILWYPYLNPFSPLFHPPSHPFQCRLNYSASPFPQTLAGWWFQIWEYIGSLFQQQDGFLDVGSVLLVEHSAVLV